MGAPVSRRTVLAAGAGAVAGLALPAATLAGASPATRVGFTLDAEVADAGEIVTSVTIMASRFGPVDQTSLTTGTFAVHVKATSPIPLAGGDAAAVEYDVDRPVTAVRLDSRGDIVLELGLAAGGAGANTLGYIPSKARNVQLHLDYTIIQRAPVVFGCQGPRVIDTFIQGRLSNPEVAAFGHHVSGSGMNYRLYAPADPSPRAAGRGRHPLIVWLHGGGEGGLPADGYYDNETTLRANRGALGFATPEAQQIFSGAYVVAPQCPSYWMEDGPRFAPLVRGLVNELMRRYPVDRARVYVVGCSNGGYMSLELTTVYRDLFAASVPICGVVEPRVSGGAPLVADADLARITTPTWLVASLDDTTVDPRANTVHAHDLIPGALLTLYDRVVWDGVQYYGHWSWIYVAHNDPVVDGLHLWQWMARQHQ